MKSMRKVSIICLLMILAVAFAACGSLELVLTADKTTAAPGETVTLSATIDGKPASEVTYSITEGAEYATIEGDKLTVKTDATAGAEIEVVAKTSTLTSKTLDIDVVVPVESIEASSNGTVSVIPGGSVILQKTVTPAGASGTIAWVIEEGEGLAAISGDVLVVSGNAPIGSTVKVHAECGEIKSNTLTFTVGVPVTAIEISANGSTEIVKGNSVTMSETLTPADASAVAITYTIVEGEDYATVNGKTLTVKSDAPTGTEIKVKATVGTVESNVLTFTVLPTQAEINQTNYFMSFEQDKITVDKNGAYAPSLVVEIYNYNFEEVSNLEIDYEIVSGSDLLSIAADGYKCSLSALGHGTATVKATIRGTDVSKTATVSVIVPPESITLPGVFVERPGYTYNFSKVNPLTSAPELLPFVATADGANVAKNLRYTFTHQSGATGDTVATYADGKITFNMTGDITVTVTSVSGSAVETSVSYRFNVNEGFNVYTFEEMRTLAANPAYTGNLPINVVVLEKPGEGYGYDLVPPVALKPQSEQTFEEVATIANRITFENKGVIINGNNHKINASGVRVITLEEIEANKALANGWDIHSSLLGIYAYTETNDTGLYTYSVTIRDLETVGNCPINLDLNTSDPKGIYKIGILVGNYHENDKIKSNYYLNMENVKASATNVGIRLLHVIDGTVKNTAVNNCFSNGIEIGGSIMTLENMVYGACGATGIELVPDDSALAGRDRNQNQQITFKGTITVEFYNNGETEYLSNKLIAGYTIPQIVQASFENSQLNDAQIAHLMNEKGFVFVTFVLHNLGVEQNASEVIYPGFQEGGIINARDLPKDGTVDTTHEYIELDVSAMGYDAGKAYLYNVNYQGNK